jgi:hypothetical protein
MDIIVIFKLIDRNKNDDNKKKTICITCGDELPLRQQLCLVLEYQTIQ